jgi:hypothetical protein
MYYSKILNYSRYFILYYTILKNTIKYYSNLIIQTIQDSMQSAIRRY